MWQNSSWLRTAVRLLRKDKKVMRIWKEQHRELGKRRELLKRSCGKQSPRAKQAGWLAGLMT